MEGEFAVAELAVASLATGAGVGAGAADDRLAGDGAGVETGAVGGLDQDLPVWHADRERALRAEAGSARTTRLSKPRIRTWKQERRLPAPFLTDDEMFYRLPQTDELLSPVR
jgi:hypothetical protein